MRYLFFIFSIAFSIGVFAQNQEMSLLFIGDIMGHDAQIESAYDASTKTYNYQPVFKKIAPLIEESDFAIANLEVTLAGKPYKGYPQFSSPDELAVACRDNGIDILVTSNNHSADRGKKGIIRTLNVLDSLNIAHTGTFHSQAERDENNLLILEKNGIRVGILNYTYGTNGIPIPEPTVVNLIDKEQMLLDIKSAESQNLDKLIFVLHWGIEYEQIPRKSQRDLAEFLFDNGVDIIIGGHPHVVQPLEYFPKSETQKERFIVYSLGNFVSNQRATPKDGGIMVKLTLQKGNRDVKISDKGYYLTWVDKQENNGKTTFEILPCAEYEENNFKDLDTPTRNKMKRYIENARTLFSKENKNVPELRPTKKYKFTTYYLQKVSLFRSLPDTSNEIIFLGNSITDGGEWSELFGNPNVKNRGISGDTTFGILNRLDEITSSNPSQVFLMIGTNDLAMGVSESEIFRNITKIVKQIQEESPNTKVYIQSILPVNDSFGRFSNHTSKTEEIKSVNQQLQKWCDTNDSIYIDLYSAFVDKSNEKMNPKYTNDGLHLTANGYLQWKSVIEKYLP